MSTIMQTNKLSKLPTILSINISTIHKLCSTTFIVPTKLNTSTIFVYIQILKYPHIYSADRFRVPNFVLPIIFSTHNFLGNKYWVPTFLLPTNIGYPYLCIPSSYEYLLILSTHLKISTVFGVMTHVSNTQNF